MVCILVRLLPRLLCVGWAPVLSSPSSKKVKGTIDLAGARLSDGGGDVDRPFVFMVVALRKVYLIQAADAVEKSAWLRALLHNITLCAMRNAGVVPGSPGATVPKGTALLAVGSTASILFGLRVPQHVGTSGRFLAVTVAAAVFTRAVLYLFTGIDWRVVLPPALHIPAGEVVVEGGRGATMASMPAGGIGASVPATLHGVPVVVKEVTNKPLEEGNIGEGVASLWRGVGWVEGSSAGW